MLSPTPDQLAVLEGFERTAFAIADAVNRRPEVKRASHVLLRTGGAAWVHYCVRNLLRIYQLEHLAALRPDRGVLLVANHRSFFDLYVISSVILRNTSWVNEMYFPVRADYFYERPDGVLVNAVMSAMAMYPPVMRSPSKRGFNRYAVEVTIELLRKSGTLVGLHPEGTRNKTNNPYKLLPANPGVGEMIYHARPIVLPVFVLGLSNNLPRQIVGNFVGKSDPITMVFGRPLDLDQICAGPARARTYQRLAARVRDELSALGQIERRTRAREGLPSLAFSPETLSPTETRAAANSS
jgi:1-acyl-sn-glycerol-3-phosphate acyltransferase